MEKQSSSDYHKYNHGEFEASVDIATLEEFSHLLQSQPKKLYSELWRRRQIQKVPPQIRRRINMQRNEQVYDPVMVSIGPYHHGKPELRRAEEFKQLCLDWRAGGDEKKKALFYSKILEQIGEIRDSYAEVTIVEKYDDKSLALMMLLDASMIIDFIHNYNYREMKGKSSSFLDWQRCLGAQSGPLMVRDMMVMENQIPFQVLKNLINLQYEREEAGLFLLRFMSHYVGIEVKHEGITGEKEDPPIHFLEAFWRVLVKKRTDTLLMPEMECSNNIGGNRSLVLSGMSMREEMNNDTDISYMHRSVMDLKAKGIRVVPNSNFTRSLRDITFRPNGGCFSQLQLPIQYVSDLTLVVCSNMIAFEVLPNDTSSLVVLSYAIFMKSLIQSPEDVKELQERGVLLNRLANLEKVVELFKEIDTFGLHDQDIFKDVKRRIEEHCSSRAKTWFAELIYTRFRTPWTAIAFFAALILLCLAFLQTFYTIKENCNTRVGPMSTLHFTPSTNIPTISTTFKNLEFCSTMAELNQHHAQIVKLGLSSDNDAMGRVLKFCAVSHSGDFNYALKVFTLLPHPDAFIYNTMFRGYLQAHLYRHCIFLYAHMLENSVAPNKFSFPPVVRACSVDGAVEGGKQVHAHVMKLGFARDSYCQNNLIHMYVNFENLEEAKRVFDNLDTKDDVSWTTMISGYSQWGCVDEALAVFELMPFKNSAAWNAVIAAHVQNNRFHEALDLFGRMREENVVMDNFVAASMLAACTGLGALEQGEWIHEHIKSSGIKVDSKLATTLIDMYCKCGSLDKAIEVFNGLSSKGASSWNCMIGGFAMHGRGRDAIKFLKKMEAEGMAKPDHVTFVNVLAACAHSGLVEEGRFYFSYMTEVYGIAPRMEHYGCLVDLLGRAGLLDEAREVIGKMPMRADVGVLGALLGACRIHGNLEMAEEIGRRVIELEPSNSGRYVLLANLYAKAGRWEDVASIRKLMNDRGVKKVAGSSIIELEGEMSEFVAGGRAHRHAREIYAKVEEMLVRIKDFGYVTESGGMMYDVGEEERENPLHCHSEKLAIAFGLLKSKPGETIRVTKNLRVCKDCHEASKLISKAYDREIIVRDRNRFHHFRGGVCSCNDYW